jgi:hypothetical protein
MIEKLVKELMWAIVPLELDGHIPAENLLIADKVPAMEGHHLFVEIERWWKGRPGEWFRLWVVGYPVRPCTGEYVRPIVLACPVFQGAGEESWVDKVRELKAAYRPMQVVATEEKVALALALSGVGGVITLRHYLINHL